MSAEVQQHIAADAAAGATLKRKAKTDEGSEPADKIPRTEEPPQTSAPLTTEVAAATTTAAATKGAPTTKVREVRLDQNRKAARESRRRKKVMIEELQRSVIFFSRANGTLKQQNDHLTRLLIQAQTQIASIEGGNKEGAAAATTTTVTAPAESKEDQAQAQAVATQAMYESQGFPAAAARAAAQTMSGSAGAETSTTTTATALPPMQPGATMQAMANFQQAAAAAMQNAMQGMSSIPGLNMSALAATPVGANAQQAYTDTMTALAMQQAAAAAAAMQTPGMTPFMANPMLWGQQAQQSAPATATAAAPAPEEKPTETKQE